MTRRLVFLSQDSMDGYVCDDDVALPVFRQHGLEVDTISWRADANWSDYDAVIVRSTWDYQRHLGDFFKTLEKIASCTRLANPLPLMRWNCDKRYLSELARAGVATVPTVFGEGLAPGQLAAMVAALETPHVIKPAVSAGSERTYRVQADMSADEIERIASSHADSVWMWQPFLKAIPTEGEYSLFYFDGHLSHAINKLPKSGDFRVQEEFGGAITAIAPTKEQTEMAAQVLGALEHTPLYARIDIVRANHDDVWQLIEVELIEPSLYLRIDEQASARFADATRQWLQQERG
ncbi:MAG: hypothetical protein AAGA84_07965 [Pseudomonadota bacterium]